jgi:hypothetical protein
MTLRATIQTAIALANAVLALYLAAILWHQRGPGTLWLGLGIVWLGLALGHIQNARREHFKR